MFTPAPAPYVTLYPLIQLLLQERELNYSTVSLFLNSLTLFIKRFFTVDDGVFYYLNVLLPYHRIPLRFLVHRESSKGPFEAV